MSEQKRPVEGVARAGGVHGLHREGRQHGQHQRAGNDEQVEGAFLAQPLPGQRAGVQLVLRLVLEDQEIGVEFLQGKITNNPYVIGQNFKMISVNTALQVDIFGQVCSQSIGYKHFSGTGGQLDTHRGAQLSSGGRGIIALRSTAKDGEISTIVPTLSPGAEVTVPSQCVDTIVTEYGIAELRGRNLFERATALIKIAHPNMRETIAAEVRKLGIVPSL